MADVIGIDLRVQDRQAISEQLARYARGLDRCDVELLKSVFHDDADIDHPPLSKAAKSFCEEVIELIRQNGRSMHFLMNTSIEFDGASAYAETYFTAWHDRLNLPNGKTPDQAKPDDQVFLGGRYMNWFECRKGSWAVSAHSTVVEWESWLPANAQTQLIALGSRRASQDRKDFSYIRPPGQLRAEK